MAGFRLSKSKILSGIQCPRRLFLEVHFPDLMEQSDGTANKIRWGHEVGDTARQLYPNGRLIEYRDDPSRALEETRKLLSERVEGPLFEAAFLHSCVLVRTDIFGRGEAGFRLVEVKSSTSVKVYHLWDCAVQSAVIEGAGYSIERVEVAHVDKRFVYPGNRNYRGLFQFQDVTADIIPEDGCETYEIDMAKFIREERDEPPGWCAISEETKIYCNRCSWHGAMGQLKP